MEQIIESFLKVLIPFLTAAASAWGTRIRFRKREADLTLILPDGTKALINEVIVLRPLVKTALPDGTSPVLAMEGNGGYSRVKPPLALTAKAVRLHCVCAPDEFVVELIDTSNAFIVLQAESRSTQAQLAALACMYGSNSTSNPLAVIRQLSRESTYNMNGFTRPADSGDEEVKSIE